MRYIHIEETDGGRVKAIAYISGTEYAAEFDDMVLATIWAEELCEEENER